MAEINLLDRYPSSSRPIEERGRRKLAGEGWINLEHHDRSNDDILLEYTLIEAARRFGREYFDGDRLYGYGGYNYHPKFWTDTVQRFAEFYDINSSSSVLDVGCAKGFMLYDFQRAFPGISLRGIDVSQYAHECAMESVKPFMDVGNACRLPYPDNAFDLVISIQTVDHLPRQQCIEAILEVQRVSRGKSFISVNAWRSDEERKSLMKWNLTALTYMHVDDWMHLFQEIGYRGDYYWFFPK
jgi:SAM-dependent methyltransferase